MMLLVDRVLYVIYVCRAMNQLLQNVKIFSWI